MKANKYTYYIVIQQNWGAWEDVDFYETNSAYCFRTKEERAAFRENRNLYQSEGGAPMRTIHRKNLNELQTN